jgi:hypothetical protein
MVSYFATIGAAEELKQSSFQFIKQRTKCHSMALMLCLDGWRANVIHCLWELINRPQPKAAESYYATCGKIAEQNWDNQEAVMIENRVTCPSSQKYALSRRRVSLSIRSLVLSSQPSSDASRAFILYSNFI